MAEEIQTLIVDTSELNLIEQHILETNDVVGTQQRALWNSEKTLRALLEIYETRRRELQIAVWAAQGLKVCPKCGQLKPVAPFKYLLLEQIDEQREHYDYLGHRLGYCRPAGFGYKIKILCAECYDKILEPTYSVVYHRRLLAEKRGEEFYIDWDGRTRGLKEIFGEEASKIPVIEEPRSLPAFTIGRSWEMERFGGTYRLKF